MADIKKIEDELWEAADELRANSKLTSQQYCMPVLGLIFLRYAWGRFKRADVQIDAERCCFRHGVPYASGMPSLKKHSISFSKKLTRSCTYLG